MKKYILFALAAICILSGCKAGSEDAAPSAALSVNTPEITVSPDISAQPSPDITPTTEITVLPQKTGQTPPTEPTEAAPETKQTSAPETKETSASEKSGLAGMIICIDAGHGITDNKGKEKIAPNSEETKPKHVSGADGSKYSEEEINLAVAKKLKSRLTELGVEVIMTREAHTCDLSNIDRAMLANDAGADLMIRIHADSSDSSSARGMSMLIPSDEYISDTAMVRKSRKIGECVLSAAAEATGAKNRGCVERPDMTGFNWSEVPVILIEMGFLSNEEDDRNLSDEDYQDKIAKGIVKGLREYYSEG